MIRKNRIVESLAEELHRQYRAAVKAMNRPKWNKRKGQKRANNPQHDHSFAACGARDYFRKRALLIMKRARTHPTTLGEAEQRFNSEVLRRRIMMGVNK